MTLVVLLDYEAMVAQPRTTQPRTTQPRRAAWGRRAGASLAALTSLLLCPGEAAAQLHWDASAQLGVMRRVLAGRPGGGQDPGFGPTGQLTGHVALLPLVHAGAYVGHDISPLSIGEGTERNITFAGLRVKGMLPFVRGSGRAWIFTGFGYAGAYQRSFARAVTVPDPVVGAQVRPGRVEGAGGSFFDVPFGIGASYKWYRPWELCAELGARLGFGHAGSVYGPPGPQLTVPGDSSQNVPSAGLDRFALGLTLGIMADL